MKYQTFINKNVKVVGLLLFMLTVLVSSCSKESDLILKGKAVVSISLSGVDFGSDSNSPLSRVSGYAGKEVAVAGEIAQRITLPFNDDFQLVATLSPDVSSRLRRSEIVASAAKGVSASTMAATTRDTIALAPGTDYVVALYKNDGTFIEKKTYSEGTTITDDSQKFTNLNTGESYTFIAYTATLVNNSGSFYALDDANVRAGVSLQDASIKIANGATNLLFYKKDVVLSSGENKLDIVLKHRLSQITSVINVPTEVGTITSASGRIKKHYSRATFNLGNESVAFLESDVVAAGATAIFPASGIANGSAVSNPSIVWANMTNGTYELTLTIDGVTKNFFLENLKITPGVRYRLVLNVTPKIGIEIGNNVWAPGNLVYDASTFTYGFAETNDARGNYFFPNYVLPKRFDIDNRNPSVGGGVNGGPGDPCALVLPLNSWRLPNGTEINALVSATAVGGKDNPGTPNQWAPARFQGNYNGTSATNVGLFFGTQISPGSNYENYLFLPYHGSYNDNNTGDALNAQGLYLLSATSGYTFLQATGIWGVDPNLAANPDYAVQIRCVKNESL